MEGLHVSDIIIHLINIVVLFLILRTLLYKPVKDFMNARSEKIEKLKLDAENSVKEAKELKSSYEEQLKNAEESAKSLISEEKKKAHENNVKLIKETEETCKNMIANAKLEAEKEREEIMQKAKDEIVAAAVNMSSKILAREVSEEDNKRVIDNFFKEMSNNE